MIYGWGVSMAWGTVWKCLSIRKVKKNHWAKGFLQVFTGTFSLQEPPTVPKEHVY